MRLGYCLEMGQYLQVRILNSHFPTASLNTRMASRMPEAVRLVCCPEMGQYLQVRAPSPDLPILTLRQNVWVLADGRASRPDRCG